MIHYFGLDLNPYISLVCFMKAEAVQDFEDADEEQEESAETLSQASSVQTSASSSRPSAAPKPEKIAGVFWLPPVVIEEGSCCGDMPLVWREPHTAIAMGVVNPTIEQFQEFCAKHKLNFDDVNFEVLKKQLLLRVAYLSKTSTPRKPLWAPLKMPANGMLPRELKALMALALTVFKDMRDEKALALISCLSRLKTMRIKEHLLSILRAK